ncbi:cupin domain-containing protein [Robertkochia aurantiaca]|uniref:cupin domain-containing protein n=1 Tax=Robertkochia aurantiaca TaxID=2873700 RepID=UPI001CCA3EE5|nr:cupin domain-containing protein [Robertkochia sp. 3YJGBD-33]
MNRASQAKKVGKTHPFKVVKDGEGMSLNVLGDHQTIKLTGEDTNGKFTLVEQNNLPGTEIPMHFHENEAEVFKVESGEVTFSTAESSMILRAGEMIFLPPLTPHSFKVTGDKPARVTLSIFPAGIENMFRALSELPEGPPDFEKIAQICGEHGVRFV